MASSKPRTVVADNALATSNPLFFPWNISYTNKKLKTSMKINNTIWK